MQKMYSMYALHKMLVIPVICVLASRGLKHAGDTTPVHDRYIHVLSSRVYQVNFIHGESSVGFRQRSIGKKKENKGMHKDSTNQLVLRTKKNIFIKHIVPKTDL